MKKLLILSILLILTAAGFSQRISELPPASSLNPGDLLPIVQSGVTKKVTAGEIVQLIQDSLSNVRILSDTCLEVNYRGTLDTICFSSGDPGFWIADGDDIENTNTGDITLNGQVYAPDIAAVPGAKFHEVIGYSANYRLFPKSIIDLYYDTMDSLDKMTSPIPYAIWRRDTTHHRVQLVHPEDTVIVSIINPPTSYSYDTSFIDEKFTATSEPWYLKSVSNDPNFSYIQNDDPESEYPDVLPGDSIRIWFMDDLSNYGYITYAIESISYFGDSVLLDYDDLVIAAPCPCTFDSIRIWGMHIDTTAIDRLTVDGDAMIRNKVYLNGIDSAISNYISYYNKLTGEITYAPVLFDLSFEFGDITAGTSQVYTLDIKASFDYTILSCCLETDAGTLDSVVIKINSTAVTGLDELFVDTSVDENDASGDNSVVSGDRIYLYVSSQYTGAPTRLRGKLKMSK